ncbi:hypothetical protein Tco_1274950 [Tanacetum coccineum]
MLSTLRYSDIENKLAWLVLTEPEDSYKDGDGDTSFQLKSDSLPHAHAQTTKTYYKHQDLRIMKAQELKTKTSANSDIQDLPSRYQYYQDNDCQGRLLASFQDDAKKCCLGIDDANLMFKFDPKSLTDNMADKNVPAPAPIRSDEQILPFAAWVPIGCMGDLLTCLCSSDILDQRRLNLTIIKRSMLMFSSNIKIYVMSAYTSICCMGAHWKEQLCSGSSKEGKESNLSDLSKTGVYSFQLDETRFTLDANLLREALEITPIDQAQQFMSHPLGDAIIDFVNELRKDFWEEFVQAIQTFLTNKENLGSPTKKGRKGKPHVILYCRFTKLIICHLGRTHNIHQRSTSPFHLAEEDFRLGNLKFVLKCEVDEVFGMPIPNELISNNIRNAPYYNAYMEMDAKHDQMVTAEKEGKKKTVSTKQPKSKSAIEKSSKPAPVSKPSLPRKNHLSPLLLSRPRRNLLKRKPAHSEPEPEPEHQDEGEEFDMERAILMSLESFQAQSQAHVGGMAIREPVAEATRLLPVVEDAEIGARSDKTNSGGDTKILLITEDLGEDVDKMENVEEKTVELDQDQVGLDSGKTYESQPLPEQESLKFPTDEHVILEDPLSSTGTLSLMKNLKDAYAIGDQFINDKSTDDEPGKLNVEAELVSMVTFPIYQASSLIPPLSTLENSMWKQKWSSWSLFQFINRLPQFLHSPHQVFTLELRDLPHKIDEAVYENVKEAVQIALQVPLRDRFIDLLEADMKEMLHQRMFETGSYKSLLEHIALYEALEASMERAQRDEFFAKRDKSRKR